jgi:hypothetical protein
LEFTGLAGSSGEKLLLSEQDSDNPKTENITVKVDFKVLSKEVTLNFSHYHFIFIAR